MAKKRKLDVFSNEFAVKLLDSMEEDVLIDLFHFIESLIDNDDLRYRAIATVIEFSMVPDFENRTDFTLPKVENSNSIETIYALMRIIIAFIEEKGEESIESFLDITEDKSSEILRNKTTLLENLISNSESLLNFVIYGSFNKSMKLEKFDYNINLDSIIIKEKGKVHLIQAPVGNLSLRYYDPQKGKINVANFSLTKVFLKKMKKEISMFYDEFEVYENIVKQKTNKKIKDK